MPSSPTSWPARPRAVREIIAFAAAGLVEALPQLATSIGHDGFEATLRDFCAMWDAEPSS